jgi:hypothetical protein
VNDLANVVKKAFHIATTGRPGPVLIDITKDATIAEIEFSGYPDTINMRSYQPEIKVEAGQISKAVELLCHAKIFNNICQIIHICQQEIMLNTRACNTHRIHFLKSIVTNHRRRHLTRNHHHWNRIHMRRGNTRYRISQSPLGNA